jgi:hypothetical protein
MECSVSDTAEQRRDREWQNEQDRLRSGKHPGLYSPLLPDPEVSGGDPIGELDERIVLDCGCVGAIRNAEQSGSQLVCEEHFYHSVQLPRFDVGAKTSHG